MTPAKTFLGDQCQRCAGSVRYISTGTCAPCARAQARAYHAKNSERVRQRKADSASAISIRQAEYHSRNRDHINSHKRAIYAENPQPHRERALGYYISNIAVQRVKSKMRRRALYAENPQAIIAANRTWRERNPEKAAMINVACKAARRARERDAPGRFTRRDVEVIWHWQGGLCAYCEADLASGVHVDHVVALANGGSNWPVNLQLTCPPCNQDKWAHDHVYYLRRIGYIAHVPTPVAA